MKMPLMPESDKVRAVAPDSQKLGEFLEWLQEQGIMLGKYVAVLHPESRYAVVECPSCTEPCWRIDDTLSLSLGPHLGRYHYDSEEEAHGVAAGLEDDRLAEAQKDPEFQPVYHPTEQLLAQYFGIDLGKVEQERRALLDSLREAQS